MHQPGSYLTSLMTSEGLLSIMPLQTDIGTELYSRNLCRQFLPERQISKWVRVPLN